MFLSFLMYSLTCAVRCTGTLLLLLPLSLPALATDYFVCSDLGDDLGPGTSPAAPWRTVGRVNRMLFRGGDRIFFNGGHVFQDAGLRIIEKMAGGDDGAPLVIGSYGGRPAVLRPPKLDCGIMLANVGGITIQNLIIEGPGRQAADVDQRGMVRAGIMFYSTRVDGPSLRGLTIAGVRVSGFFTGILIGANESAMVGYQDILIAGCTIFGNVHCGIELYGLFQAEHPRTAPNGGGMDYPKPISDVLITGCEISAHQGTALWTFPKATGCGIILSGVDGAVVDRCYVHDNGGIGPKKKADSYGIWTFNAERVTVQRCLVRNQIRFAGNKENRADGVSFGGGTARSMVRQSAVHNCQKSAFSLFHWKRSGGSSHDNAFVSNVSVGNGSDDAPSLLYADFGTRFTRVIGNLDLSARGSATVWDKSLESSNAFCNNILLMPAEGTVPDRCFFRVQSHQLATMLVRGNVYWSASAASPGGWQWGDRFYRTLAELRRCPVSAFMGNPPETRGGVATGMQEDPGLKLPQADGAPTTIAEMLSAPWQRPPAAAPWLSAGVDLEGVPGVEGIPLLRTFLNAKREPGKGVIPGPFGSGMKAPVIVSPPVATGVVGQPFSYAIRAEPAAKIFRARGLPPEWSLNARTGVITGLAKQPLTARIILSVGLEDLPDLDDELHLVLIIEPAKGAASGPGPKPAKP
jgi:hypothetical protein